MAGQGEGKGLAQGKLIAGPYAPHRCWSTTSTKHSSFKKKILSYPSTSLPTLGMGTLESKPSSLYAQIDDFKQCKHNSSMQAGKSCSRHQAKDFIKYALLRVREKCICKLKLENTSQSERHEAEKLHATNAPERLRHGFCLTFVRTGEIAHILTRTNRSEVTGNICAHPFAS
eukprot:1139574-Pelagomonas_calceolata.AAC.4